MKNKILMLSVVFFVILSSSCTNENLLYFKLPNGEQLLQTQIKDLEKEYKYEQYMGFVLKYSDTLLSSPILMIKNNNSITGADVLNEKQIEKLKQSQIVALKFVYKLPNNQKLRDSLFEKKIKFLYKDYNIVQEFKNGFMLLKDEKELAKVELHTFGNPNYSIEIYPQEK